MSNEKVSDDVIVEDGTGRRRFMRRGATFVAAVGAVSTVVGRSALAASDCDRGGPGGKKPEYAGNGSDSDKGASADPTGCGRNREEAPKISMSAPDSEASETRPVTVAKISG